MRSATPPSKPPPKREYRIPWLIAGGAVGVIVVAAVFGPWGRAEREEERALYQDLRAFLSPEAEAQYLELPRSRRLPLAREADATLAKLRPTDWEVRISGVNRLGDSEPPRWIYGLGVGEAELEDCSFPSSDQDLALLAGGAAMDPAPQGRCESFTHAAPGRLGDDGVKRTKNIEVFVYLSPEPYAESREDVRLPLSRARGVEAEGMVRIDHGDVRVQDSVLVIPHPVARDLEADRLEIPDFSLQTTPQLRSLVNWDLDATYDMPPLLGHFFDDAERLTVVRLQAAVAVDLTQPEPGYHLESQLTVLNRNLGHGTVDYYPGQFASISVPNLVLPGALPGVCFNVRDGLLELDLGDQRIRASGGMELKSVEGFSCSFLGEGEQMGMATHLALTATLEQVRSFLGIPEYLHTTGHMVVDLDDQILCGDLSANNKSFFRAAYLGSDGRFSMDAPKRFSLSEMGSGDTLSTLISFGKAFTTADWTFPERDPMSCFTGDPGPRTEAVRRSLVTAQ